jgi:hypothetical protein
MRESYHRHNRIRTFMETEITLHITLLAPPAGVDFGLQRGRGHHYETIGIQRSTGADLTFLCTLPFPLRGPFVQGPPAGRFLYLDIGTAAGQPGSPWSRRLKVPLTGLTGDHPAYQTQIPGQARDGGPTCATPKPFAGWTPLS